MADSKFYEVYQFRMPLADATKLVQRMWSLIKDVGYVTVGDYYRMAGHPEIVKPIDERYVWTQGNVDIEQGCIYTGFNPTICPVLTSPVWEEGEWAVFMPLPHQIGTQRDPCEANVRCPNPHHILRNGPATVVFWNDGTKTLVKKAESTQEDEWKDDIYGGFCAALAKKIYGNNSAIKRMIYKNLKVETEDKKNG